MIDRHWYDACPYGTAVTLSDIESTFAILSDWETRYGYLIDLGKDLPPLASPYQTATHLIHGCQSQVWLHYEVTPDNHLQLMIQSDALIVRGLIAVVLAAYQNQRCAIIAELDIDAVFARLDLLRHLSPTRGNGLRALVAQIRSVARQCVAAAQGSSA